MYTLSIGLYYCSIESLLYIPSHCFYVFSINLEEHGSLQYECMTIVLYMLI